MEELIRLDEHFENYSDFIDFHFPRFGVPRGWTPLKPPRNSFAYRCEEFEPRGVLNVLCIGDSCTESDNFGREQVWPGILCGLLSERFGARVGNWNVGMGGGSYDFISRVLVCSLPVLNPDVVAIALPTMSRREFFKSNGRRIRVDNSTATAVNQGQLHPVESSLHYYRNWPTLDSNFDDIANAIKNFKITEHALNKIGVIWGYGVNGYFDWKDLTAALREHGWFEAQHYFGFDFDVIDQVSKSDVHPGPESHRLFGQRIFDWLMEHHEGSLRIRVDEHSGTIGAAG